MRARDLYLPADALRDNPTQLSLRWLGTAGFELRYRGAVLLIDPYVTRPSLLRCLRPVRPDWRAIYRYITSAQAIAVGHSHFDHALDVPAIAQHTGATVLGSSSTMALCRYAGVSARQLVAIEPAQSETINKRIGPFELAFALSRHSPLALGQVPFAGDIRDDSRPPRFIHQYRCGSVLRITIRVAGRTIDHLGSAALPQGPPAGEPSDLLLLTASGWHTSTQLPERVIAQLAPRHVVLSHWDDFFRSLRRPVRQLPGLRLAELVDRLKRADPHVRVGTIPLFGELAL